MASQKLRSTGHTIWPRSSSAGPEKPRLTRRNRGKVLSCFGSRSKFLRSSLSATPCGARPVPATSLTETGSPPARTGQLGLAVSRTCKPSAPAAPRTSADSGSSMRHSTESRRSAAKHQKHHHLPHFHPLHVHGTVAACEDFLKEHVQHLIPHDFHRSDLRSIYSAMARDGRVQYIHYAHRWSNVGWNEWNFPNYDRTGNPTDHYHQEQILKLFNDHLAKIHPQQQHRPLTMREATTSLQVHHKNELEEFLIRDCVVQIITKDDGKTDRLLWTRNHLRELAEAKHGKDAADAQYIRVKGGRRDITVHRAETQELQRAATLRVKPHWHE